MTYDEAIRLLAGTRPKPDKDGWLWLQIGTSSEARDKLLATVMEHKLSKFDELLDLCDEVIHNCEFEMDRGYYQGRLDALMEIKIK